MNIPLLAILRVAFNSGKPLVRGVCDTSASHSTVRRSIILRYQDNNDCSIRCDVAPLDALSNDGVNSILIVRSIARSHGVLHRLDCDTSRSTLARLTGHTDFRGRLHVLLRAMGDARRQRTLIFVSLSHFGTIGSDTKRTTNSTLLHRLTSLVLDVLHSDSILTQLNKSRFNLLLPSYGIRDTHFVTAHVVDTIGSCRFV